MLIFAYVIRFLPQAVGAIESALLQINPRVEEAARSLGRSPLQVLWEITLPLTRSGLLSAAALVFLPRARGPLGIVLGATSVALGVVLVASVLVVVAALVAPVARRLAAWARVVIALRAAQSQERQS